MATTADAASGPGVVTTLVRVSHLVQRVFADVARVHGLPPQQLQLLCVLVDGPIGMSELGRLLNLERSSMTGLVDRVEKRGLAARVADPADRRACMVTLSDEGLQLARAAHDDVTARLESMTRRLDPGDRARLASTHARILSEHDPSWVSRR